MKTNHKLVWLSMAIVSTAVVTFILLNTVSFTASAKESSKLSIERTEEYLMVTYSNLDKNNVVVWFGHNKKEIIAIAKDQPVVDPMINVMHSLNSEGWELVNNESFPYLNIVGTASNLDSDAYHTILFVMKRKLNPADE
jgi:hypothetical protein